MIEDLTAKLELGTPGKPGKRAEFRVTADAIEWRYVGDAGWQTLILRSLIEGDRGVSVLDITPFSRSDGGVDLRFDMSDGISRTITFTLLTPQVMLVVDQLNDLVENGTEIRNAVAADAQRAEDAAAAAETFDPANYYSRSQTDGLLTLKAPLASPVFTGNPAAPTPAAGDNDTSIATTAFVRAITDTLATKVDAALTGNPTAPTPPVGDDDTSIATTAFVQRARRRALAYTFFMGN